MEHPIEWTAPSPCWRGLAGAGDAPTRSAFRQPALLRFATDTFMDDFTAMLDVDPGRLEEFRARPETWRGPARAVAPTPAAPSFARKLQRKRLALRGAASARVDADPARPVLKLYQPAHQRYYLIAASLICQLPGLPDRGVDSTRDERVTFVLRRLLPRAGVTAKTPNTGTWDEYAFVSGGWRTVSLTASEGASHVETGEEQLPLFPAGYVDEDERRRRLYAGLVPVARREGYLGASPQPAPEPSTSVSFAGATPVPADARLSLLQKQVTEPWRQLIARGAFVEGVLSKARAETPNPTQAEREKTRREAREQLQVVSWYVVLDFAKFLEEQVPTVWAVIRGQSASLSASERSLLSALEGATYTRDGSVRRLRDVLVAIRNRETELDRITTPYVEGVSGWPERFSLVALRSTEELSFRTGDQIPAPVERFSGLTPSTLEARVRAALPAQPAGAVPAAPLASRPVLAPGDPGWFVIRCVYERPQCGRLSPPTVSDPTEVFQLAGFFDPDAPARPIRIGLPIDVSPAGLRKFDKNTAFMVSDILCGHVQRVKSLTLADLVLSVLPWPFHKDLPTPEGGACTSGGASIGMICSISIPIITICALILLMIIVSLLDMIFKWMPYFLICFPLPNFKGKESA